MTPPRIFVSHSHKDDAFTQRLVDDLHRAGAQVWVDKAGIQHGNFMERIDEALAQSEWFVLVLTPNAVESPYVRQETYTALHRVQQALMHAVIPILAAPCPSDSIPPQWDALHRYDATQDYPSAVEGVVGAVGLTGPTPPRETTASPRETTALPRESLLSRILDWIGGEGEDTYHKLLWLDLKIAKTPNDFRLWRKKAGLLRYMDRDAEAQEAERRAEELGG